jgi:hypothetical protein
MTRDPAPVARPFQRIGAIINTHAGRTFQDAVQLFLLRLGLELEREFAVAIGHAIKKSHRFDLGSADPPILVECKSYTWTSGGNSPSAKLRGLNEAMLLFSVAPPEYRKLLVMLRHLRRDESLAANWLRNHGHLVPPGVEIWELDADTGAGACLLGPDENAPNGGDHRAAPTA